MEKSTFRSIAAVVAGVLAILFAAKIMDVVLYNLHVYRGATFDERTALVASAHRLLITIAGGWLTARLAPGKPIRHALILGVVDTAMNLFGAAMWDQNYGPIWFPIWLAVLAIPECWLGATLFVRSQRAAAPAAEA